MSWFSVFVSSWTVDAAIGLCARLGFDAPMGFELLTGLLNRSLVAAAPGLMPPRYQLLDRVREHAFRQLCTSNEEDLAQRAHLLSVVRLCEASQVDMATGRMRERIGQLVHEHGNIVAAIAYAAARPDERAQALRILGSLMLYVKAHGAYEDALRWGRIALEATDGIETTERARALLCLGVVLVHRGTDPQLVGTALSYAQWHADGTEMQNSGFHAPNTSNFCMGVWKQTGRRTYRLNHFPLAWDSTGDNPANPIQLTMTVRLTDENHFTGSFTLKVYNWDGTELINASGPPVAVVTGTISAERVTIDSTVPGAE